MPTRRITMADIRFANRAHAKREGRAYYFDRAASRFFGGDRFSGPYAGPGGVFFVQVNDAGIMVKQAMPSGAIDTVGNWMDGYATVASATAAAKAMAHPGLRKSNARPKRRAVAKKVRRTAAQKAATARLVAFNKRRARR